MTKYMVCVKKTVEVFEHFFVEASNDLDAKTKAIKIAKDNLDIKWTHEDKPIYKAEVVQ
jgi:hypothetical protein